MINGHLGELARVVSIEDNPGDVRLLREALKKYELLHELTVFADGEAALNFVERAGQGGDPPDLIVLDLNLPFCTGLEILEQIRATPALARVPVAILTTSDAPSDREAAARLGADEYLRKPPNLDEFLELGAPLKRLCLGQGWGYNVMPPTYCYSKETSRYSGFRASGTLPNAVNIRDRAVCRPLSQAEFAESFVWT